MATTQTTDNTVIIKAVRSYADTISNGLSTGPVTCQLTYKPAQWASGTSASQADLAWVDTRTLNTTSEELDLNALTLQSTAETINMAEVAAVAHRPDTTTSGQTLTIGNAAATQFQGPFGAATATFIVDAGGFYYTASPVDGWTTSSDNDYKMETNYNGTYTSMIVGRSA